MILMRIEYQNSFKGGENAMTEIYRNSMCIIYTKNKSGLYTDIYGNHIRISSVKARYISNQLQRNNYNVLNMLHA